MHLSATLVKSSFILQYVHILDLSSAQKNYILI